MGGGAGGAANCKGLRLSGVVGVLSESCDAVGLCVVGTRLKPGANCGKGGGATDASVAVAVAGGEGVAVFVADTDVECCWLLITSF